MPRGRPGSRQVCKVVGCDELAHGSGYCIKHYHQFKKFPLCKVEGCDKPVHAHNYCDKHYKRWVKWGTPYYVKKTHDISPEGRQKLRENIAKNKDKNPIRKEKCRKAIREAHKKIPKEKLRENLQKMQKAKYRQMNKVADDRTFFTSFIKRHCPEIDTSDDIPVTVYRELIEFFHPELMPTLEREWRMYLDD